MNLTATLDIKDAYSDDGFVVISVPANCDSSTQLFYTAAVKNAIEEYIPNAILIIISTIPVGYTESVHKEYGSKNIIFSPEFLCKSKEHYDNG